MQIRAARDTDQPGIRGVLDAAFGVHDVAALWEDVEARAHVRLSLVGVDDTDVIGHVGLSHGWLDTRRALLDVLVLSPLAVDPSHQGTGIGTALLAAAVEAARATDGPLLVLEGSPRYYGARGFAPAAEHGIEPATRRTPASACQVVLLPGHEPWMTGRIVYRDVWWEHDAAGLRDPGLAEVERVLGVGGADQG